MVLLNSEEGPSPPTPNRSAKRAGALPMFNTRSVIGVLNPIQSEKKKSAKNSVSIKENVVPASLDKSRRDVAMMYMSSKADGKEDSTICSRVSDAKDTTIRGKYVFFRVLVNKNRTKDALANINKLMGLASEAPLNIT